jgi:hypothetical protein
MNAVLDWFSPTRIIIVLGLALALLASVLGYGEVRYSAGEKAAEQVAEAAILKLKTQAAMDLATETRKVLALERALANVTAKLEADYEKRRMDSRAAETALAADAARNGGRLRDPNAGRGICGGGAPGAAAAGAASSAAPGAEAPGLLSEPLTRLLQRVASEAQGWNDAFALCRAHAIEVNGMMNSPLSPHP